MIWKIQDSGDLRFNESLKDPEFMEYQIPGINLLDSIFLILDLAK